MDWQKERDMTAMLGLATQIESVRKAVNKSRNSPNGVFDDMLDLEVPCPVDILDILSKAGEINKWVDCLMKHAYLKHTPIQPDFETAIILASLNIDISKSLWGTQINGENDEVIIKYGLRYGGAIRDFSNAQDYAMDVIVKREFGGFVYHYEERIKYAQLFNKIGFYVKRSVEHANEYFKDKVRQQFLTNFHEETGIKMNAFVKKHSYNATTFMNELDSIVVLDPRFANNTYSGNNVKLALASIKADLDAMAAEAEKPKEAIA